MRMMRMNRGTRWECKSGRKYTKSVYTAEDCTKWRKKHGNHQLEEDAKAAAAIGLSYGMYEAKKLDGTLDDYIERWKKRQQEPQEDVNIIPSNVLGGSFAGSRCSSAAGAAKL